MIYDSLGPGVRDRIIMLSLVRCCDGLCLVDCAVASISNNLANRMAFGHGLDGDGDGGNSGD